MVKERKITYKWIWAANWEIGCEALGIEGYFDVRSNEEKEASLPRYGLSWVVD